MPQRKKARPFAARIYHTKEERWIEPGDPVNLEHLSDADYKTITDMFPEGMDPADADALVRDAADAAAVRHGAKEK